MYAAASLSPLIVSPSKFVIFSGPIPDANDESVDARLLVTSFSGKSPGNGISRALC